MNLPGHLAVAHLVARGRGPVRLERLGLVALGALLPDLIDKPLMMLGGVTPYGRTVGHSLVFWSLALSFWMLAVRGRLRAHTAVGLVVAGGLSHLFADLVDDLVEGVQSSGYAFSAWAGWPITNPDMWTWRVTPLLPIERTDVTTVLELATVAASVAFAARHRPAVR